jgi:hypothetical protein
MCGPRERNVGAFSIVRQKASRLNNFRGIILFFTTHLLYPNARKSQPISGKNRCPKACAAFAANLSSVKAAGINA